MSRNPRIYDPRRLDRLADLFIKLRIRRRYRLTFAQFIEAPEVWIPRADARLRDWTDNPRWLQMAQTPLILN